MNEKIKIKIILGSTRNARFGERPATWINDELKEMAEVDTELIDLRDYPMPFFDSVTSPMSMKMDYPDKIVQKWSAKINDGDAFIIVTPEYNHGYPGVLKNAMDWIFPEWVKKPVGFVGYGSVGGARVIEQLREVVIDLKMVPIYRSINLNWEFIMKAQSNKDIPNSELFAPLRNGNGADHLAVFIEDLLWMARALKSAREKG